MKARALDQRAHSGHIPGWRCQWHTKYSARTRERTHEPEQHPQRRGLPGTVGSDEPSDDAIGYLHVETIDDAAPTVTLGQPARLDRSTAADLLRLALPLRHALPFSQCHARRGTIWLLNLL